MLLRARWLPLLLVLLPAAGSAQASPYVPLDDPRLPAFEHLVARGEVIDPAPLVRPFRRSDAVRMLDSALAEGGARDTALIGELRRAWSEDTSEAHWEIEARAGAQGYTQARRDPLHPAGPDGVQPYGDLRLQATFGNIVLVSRPAIERRVIRDPDWPGRRNIEIAGRHLEGYLSAQFRWVSLFYGQMDQNWGPVGVPGIGVSNYGYPRPQFGFEVGNGRFRLSAQAASLADESDSTGAVVHRYFFAHRASARVSKRLSLSLWETVVLTGVDRSFDGRYRNPVTLLLLANQYGLGDDGNVLLGLDVHWRLGHGTTLMGQFGLDDFQYQNRSGPTRTPDRYAFTLMGTGPLLQRLAWRALYTQASSLAFRTTDPFQSFTDAGVGIGRAYADNDQVTLTVSAPVTRRWLITPELTLLRQGQGQLSDPFPQGTARGATPTLFIGTVERTWRAAIGVSGQQGRLAIQGNAGIHQVENAGHVSGVSRTRIIARVQATIGLGTRGHF
jgi:hypothetical protein